MESNPNNIEYYNSFDKNYIKETLTDLIESKIPPASIPVTLKRKYWYRTDINSCVLCGHETVDRTRVYSEDQKGMHFTETACNEHFM
jgi:hypothetical protein